MAHTMATQVQTQAFTLKCPALQASAGSQDPTESTIIHSVYEREKETASYYLAVCAQQGTGGWLGLPSVNKM